MEYKSLENDIEVLEQKQLALSDLKELEETFKDVERQFVILDYQFAVQSMEIAREKHEKAQQELNDTRQEIEYLEKRKPRLQRILENSRDKIDRYRKGLDVLNDYADEHKER
ncbi:MAG: hypothetical protein R3A44_14155 [Caldilineaceae bacterium]